jgi:hypothetical protein
MDLADVQFGLVGHWGLIQKQFTFRHALVGSVSNRWILTSCTPAGVHYIVFILQPGDSLSNVILSISTKKHLLSRQMRLQCAKAERPPKGFLLASVTPLRPVYGTANFLVSTGSVM